MSQNSTVIKFAVVDFYKEEVVDYVPLSWIKGDKCAWPSVGGKRLTLAQNKLREDPTSTPGEGWAWYPVKILRLCDSVTKARKKTKRRELNPDTDLESSEPAAKKRAKPIKTVHTPSLCSSSSLGEIHDSDNEPSTSFTLNTLHYQTCDNLNGSELEEPVDHTSLNGGSGNDVIGAVEPTYVLSSEITLGDVYTLIHNLNERLESIESVQASLLTQITSIKQDLELILANSCVESNRVRGQLPNHPVENSDQLKELEDWISDLEKRKLLVQYLSNIGGRTVKEKVYGVLARLFSNTFARQVNFLGRNSKIPFKSSPLLGVVKESVETGTEVEIELAAKSWFRTAKGRKAP